MVTVNQLCPECTEAGALVSQQTMIHQLKLPWKEQGSKEGYFFCANKRCDIVYFADSNLCFKTKDLRQKVGVKSADDDELICYCFDVSFAEAKKDGSAKAYVIAQTKAGQCACKVRNPSGSCCLKDFP